MTIKKQGFFFLLSSLLAMACSSGRPGLSSGDRAPNTISAEAIVFTNVSVLPMHGPAPVLMRPAQTVVVEKGRIAYVGEAKFKFPEGTTVIDGTGKYLMPGISEMHAHVPAPQNGDTSQVKDVLFLYLSNGITTIRGMLGQPYHLELKKKIAAGEIMGPRLYTSSPSLNGNSVQTPAEARLKVTQYAADGYDFLKIHPGIQLPVMEELVKTAKKEKISFSGHVPTAVGIERAIAFGYASIDHIDGYIEGLVPPSAGVNPDAGGLFGFDFTPMADAGRIPDLVRKTKEAGVWVVPTQGLLVRWVSPVSGAELTNEPEMVYVSGGARFQWRQFKDNLQKSPGYSNERAETFLGLRRQLLKQMYEQQVGLLLGSDAPQMFNVPGFSIQHEMRSWADAGIPNVAILKAGTMNVAQFFRAENEFGAVRPGLAADLLLLDANPVEDIRHMQQIAGVMTQGRWLSREEIDKGLKAIAAKYQN